MIDISKYNLLSYSVIGAAMEVHRQLGFGFLENVYQKAFEEECRIRSISFFSQQSVPVWYKGKELSVYVPDLIPFNQTVQMIVEIKALETIDYDKVGAQVIKYLVATKKEVGLLINFGKKKLEYRRYVIPQKFQKHSAFIRL